MNSIKGRSKSGVKQKLQLERSSLNEQMRLKETATQFNQNKPYGKIPSEKLKINLPSNIQGQR